jgi:hypothetical protein
MGRVGHFLTRFVTYAPLRLRVYTRIILWSAGMSPADATTYWALPEAPK